AIYVTDHLISDMANVSVYDPQVPEKSMIEDLNYLQTRPAQENKEMLTVHQDAYEACKDAHAIAIITEWDEFKDLDWQKIYQNMKKPAFLFDGRNLLNHEELEKIGFKVKAIGKG
ncbi:MAG: UDP binding domain-containing protein, partial [Bacteroidota bacterium]